MIGTQLGIFLIVLGYYASYLIWLGKLYWAPSLRKHQECRKSSRCVLHNRRQINTVVPFKQVTDAVSCKLLEAGTLHFPSLYFTYVAWHVLSQQITFLNIVCKHRQGEQSSNCVCDYIVAPLCSMMFVMAAFKCLVANAVWQLYCLNKLKLWFSSANL